MGAKKVILIVGMGPATGLGLAHRFGREGYTVAMISRNANKLRGYAEELKALDIDSAWRTADILDRPGLKRAIGELGAELGRIDVMEYSPLLDMAGLINVLDITDDQALEQIEFQLLGAIAATNAVLPSMRARGSGALLYTTGASAYIPAPSHANGALGVRALRHYAVMLNMALKRYGVYVGTISIGRPHTGEEMAQMYWSMAEKRDHAEELLADPRLFHAYEEFVCAGLGETYPPAFTGELPAPEGERDRNVQLISIFHVRSNMIARGESQDEIDAVGKLAIDRGGDLDAPYYGGNLDAVCPPLFLR